MTLGDERLNLLTALVSELDLLVRELITLSTTVPLDKERFCVVHGGITAIAQSVRSAEIKGQWCQQFLGLLRRAHAESATYMRVPSYSKLEKAIQILEQRARQ